MGGSVGARRKAVRIVFAGMEPAVEVSDLCCVEGLNPTMSSMTPNFLSK